MIDYTTDIDFVSNLDLPWEKLEDSTILVTGATGMIGTFLIKTLLNKKRNIRVIAVGRNVENARERFSSNWEDGCFTFLVHDINKPLKLESEVDYVIHAASNTHPFAYSSDPVGTIITNIIGTRNLLDLSVEKQVKRFLFLSSVEIYGENRGDVDYFTEDYCGYIDCNTLRAGYPEGKRAGEALCQAYRKRYNLDSAIARLSRTYGPSMQMSDTKAISQFIKKGIAREDIILKSEGNQLYSYNYVADSVSAVLTILLKGKCGEAYNVSDKKSDITLRDLADLIANYMHVDVKFELPDDIEKAGYSKATKALMESEKLSQLGWKTNWNIKEGISRTLDLLSVSEKQSNS